jgi:hypothetical protein
LAFQTCVEKEIMRIVALSLLALSIALSVGPLTGIAQEPKDFSVSGLYTGNGQESKLAFVHAYKDDSEKERYVLLFTEKDPSKEKMPRLAAAFGRCGSALILTVTPEGRIVGCEVCHASLNKRGFTAIGDAETTDFKIANGKISGKVTTNGEIETFGDKWQVKIQFEVKKP